MLPHAGGGAAAYRGWRARLPADVELVLLHLPGREARLAEPPLGGMDELVAHLASEMASHAQAPYAIFGHSFGALVAYELARRLPQQGAAPPARLFVSAHRPPGAPDPRGALHTWPPERLVEELVRLGGTPREVLEHPELVALLLPAFRADLSAVATWRPAPEPRLACGITAFGGTHDPLAGELELRGWRALAADDDFRLQLFDGGHFYLHAEPTAAGFLQALAAELPHGA